MGKGQRYICLMIALWLGVGIAAQSAVAQETSLIEFELKDQFDKVYRTEDYSDRIVVVIGSDKDGSDYNPIWGKALHDALEGVPGYETIDFLPFAHLTGVPFFIKGMVRGRFPKEPDQWALMDWKGVFDDAYGLVPEATTAP